MKTPRVIMSSIALAAFLLGFFVVPMPVTRVRSPGLVLYQPDDMTPVHVAVPGILKKVHVREGEKVTKGKVLAEFASPEKEVYRISVRSELDLKRKLVELYTQRLGETRDAREKQNLQSSLAHAEGERDKAQRTMEFLDKEMERLTIVAPRDGYATGVPQLDEIGRRWDTEQGQPLCSIGNRRKLRVMVPVESADFDLVRENLARCEADRRNLPVTIRVQGRGSKTWPGRVNPDLPRQYALEIPLALSSKGGGPVAVRPSSDPSKLIPQAQVYLVAVDFEDPDEAICTGMLAQVKIHNEYRSSAWWCWRAISQAIDLYLL